MINWQLLKYKFLRFVCFHHLEWMSDEAYLKMMYRIKMGKSLDLDNPKTFNEKLQWLKIHDRKPEYAIMVDKYAVKKYVADIIGEEYIVPTFGKWGRFDDIDFDKLPNQFVLKCNHSTGGIVIVQDKRKFDREAARKKLEKKLKRNHFWYAREWVYKDVQPCIIAEKYIEDSGKDLKDYKIHCFNGEPKLTLVCCNRFNGGGLTEDFFDINWRHVPVARMEHPFSSESIREPKSYVLMLNLAKKLAEEMKFLRVDFYNIAGRIYFGELTFYPAAGLKMFEPPEWDEIFGSWLNLVEGKCLK